MTEHASSADEPETNDDSYVDQALAWTSFFSAVFCAIATFSPELATAAVTLVQ